MVPDAVAALGGLDVLINNAGIAGLTLPIAEYPPDDWDKVIAVNLTAMFDVSRLAIPHLKKSKAGCIINMSSIAGRYGFANRSPYAATKWGVIGLTKTLAMELGEWGSAPMRLPRCGRGRAHCPRLSRSRADQRQVAGRSEGRCAGSRIDQGHDRPEGHRAACGVPCLRRREIDLGAGCPDRQRPSEYLEAVRDSLKPRFLFAFTLPGQLTRRI